MAAQGAPSPGRGRGGRGRSRGKGGRGGGRGGSQKGKQKDKGDGNGKEEGARAPAPRSSGSGAGAGAGRGNNRPRHFSARGGGALDVSARSEASLPAAAAQDPPLPANGGGAEDKVKGMSDQDVLIAFGPFVRAGDPRATAIHKEYLARQRQDEFISNARRFLVEKESQPEEVVAVSPVESKPQVDVAAAQPPSVPKPPPGLQAPAPPAIAPTPPPGMGMGSLPPPQPSLQPATVTRPPPPGLGSLPQQIPAVPNPVSLGGGPPGMPPQIRPPTAANGMTSTPSKAVPSSILPARTPPTAAKATEAPATTPGRPMRVRRTQTRCEEQPGRLFANDMPNPAYASTTPGLPSKPTSLTARLRSELTARWLLPLPYLHNRALRRFEEQKALNPMAPPQNLTIRDALRHLAVGLFRRGATETGAQSAIVSKEILAADDGSAQPAGRPAKDYFFNVDQRADAVFGTVPFYAPRTPGNVVFRLYFEDEPHVTLATGPCVRVVPSDDDIDSVLRFILSNFKSKKTNGMSSMNSLASVLELFSPSPNTNERYLDAAGRVAWGAMCESRKVVHKAGRKYLDHRAELERKIAEEKEAEKIKADLPDLTSLGIEDSDANGALVKGEKDANAANDAQSKLATELYSNERKWREMQQVYASILKAIVSSEANQMLMKRDISKIRLEWDLWCPFVEAFAPNPFVDATDEASTLPGDISAFPNIGTKENMKKAHDSRNKTQEKVLGFLPRSTRPLTLKGRSHKWKKSGLDFFTELSSAMNELYRDEYAVSDRVWRRRENVRATIERVVSASGEFPAGTKVAVFGSSANGFGSPSSDLDLCLQVPPTATDFTKEKGVEAMTALAVKFTEVGMTDVDTVRLTARIPIVKFNVPHTDEDGQILVECDLSLQNPLACLNTTLLHAYSKISPTACVLASIIKRFAKNRDINNPSQHTLSSYGYVIMLLHFLTSCDFDADGFVVTPEDSSQINPILPNLQWVDPLWAQKPDGPYREIAAKPKAQQCMVQHPTESKYYVNSYFYRTELDGLKQFCSENHNPQSAIGALLAAFFHYYAYDYDYKKHFVSLNRRHSSYVNATGVLELVEFPAEREVKAEEDGWSLYRQGLAIEDPFELFYDVAHVVKAANFHQIRKEFSLAYSKISNAAMASKELPTGREVIDSICEPVSKA